MKTMAKKENKKSRLSPDEFKQFIAEYFHKQLKFKQIEKQFVRLKGQFNSNAEDYFECNDISKSITLNYSEAAAMAENSADNLVVRKIKQSSIEFEPNKLEKVLGKELSQDVIIKKHEIIDMSGLITYLKECNVDPNIFKSFIFTAKSVNTKELDRLEAIGKITASQIDGCYTVQETRQYFTVSVCKGQGDND